MKGHLDRSLKWLVLDPHSIANSKQIGEICDVIKNLLRTSIKLFRIV